MQDFYGDNEEIDVLIRKGNWQLATDNRQLATGNRQQG
jgi:hypothetical protein